MSSLDATSPSDDANHILVLVNRKAGAGKLGHLLNHLLGEIDCRNYVVERITDLDELSARSHLLHKQGLLRTVIAAGGDGTAATTIQHIPCGTPVCIFPLGTENLLAKYLQQHANPSSLVEMIERGVVIRLDAGQANGRIFLLMLSCGFDADVVRRLHENRQGNITHLSYAKPIYATLRNYEYPTLNVDCESEEGSRLEEQAKWVFVVNLPRYAVGLNLMPGAVGTDGLLDLCTFQHGSWWNTLRYLSGVILDQHHGWDDCFTHQVRKIRIESNRETEVPFQLDGDPGGVLPVDVEVLPQRLTLLVSETWAKKHGFEVRKPGN